MIRAKLTEIGKGLAIPGELLPAQGAIFTRPDGSQVAVIGLTDDECRALAPEFGENVWIKVPA